MCIFITLVRTEYISMVYIDVCSGSFHSHDTKLLFVPKKKKKKEKKPKEEAK